MISFTAGQLVFLEEFFNHLGIQDGITKFDEFNRNYKRPSKKRPELEHDARCHALKKDMSRCNGRRNIPGNLCGIHISRGTPHGLIQGPLPSSTVSIEELFPEIGENQGPLLYQNDPGTTFVASASLIASASLPFVQDEEPMTAEKLNELMDAFFV